MIKITFSPAFEHGFRKRLKHNIKKAMRNYLTWMLVFGISACSTAPVSPPESPPIPEASNEAPAAEEESRGEQFLQQFLAALETEDAEKIGLLLQDNPTIAREIQQALQQAEGEDEQAQQARALGDFLEELLGASAEGDNSDISELQRLHQEGTQAYHHSDYPTALQKWEQGLKLARELEHQQAISLFIGNIGLVYRNLGQYPKALDYYRQALAGVMKITLYQRQKPILFLFPMTSGKSLPSFGLYCLSKILRLPLNHSFNRRAFQSLPDQAGTQLRDHRRNPQQQPGKTAFRLFAFQAFLFAKHRFNYFAATG